MTTQQRIERIAKHAATKSYVANRTDLLEVLTIALTEFAEEEASKWQPISSAPKDGTDILALVPPLGQLVVSWHQDEYATGWITEWHRSDTRTYEPTHWQPLPRSTETRLAMNTNDQPATPSADEERDGLQDRVIVLEAECFALSENLKDRRTRVERLERQIGDCTCADWGAMGHTKDCPAHSSNSTSLRAALAERDRKIDRLTEELNWQNNRNSGHPTRGGFEFYINEEWQGLARAAIDTDPGWHATLLKKRFDPDDERVRVRRVIEDDALLSELSGLRSQLQAATSRAEGASNRESDLHKWARARIDEAEAKCLALEAQVGELRGFVKETHDVMPSPESTKLLTPIPTSR